MSGPSTDARPTFTPRIRHMGAGPVFLLTWPFFSDGPWAPLAAALVPFAMTLKFALTGLGVLSGKSAKSALMSRAAAASRRSAACRA